MQAICRLGWWAVANKVGSGVKGLPCLSGVGEAIDLVILYPRILLNIMRGPPKKPVCLLVDLCLRCCADVSGICLAEKIPCGGECSCCVG